MVETLILLGGSALIMSGMFGLIEVAIQSRRSHAVQTAGVQRRHAPAPAEEPEATEVEERYLEFTVVRDREANPDGQSRQRIISDLEVGDAVVLVPETAENGGRDIRVVASAGTIGYVPPQPRGGASGDACRQRFGTLRDQPCRSGRRRVQRLGCRRRPSVSSGLGRRPRVRLRFRPGRQQPQASTNCSG
jgi:hypothetical protein